MEKSRDHTRRTQPLPADRYFPLALCVAGAERHDTTDGRTNSENDTHRWRISRRVSVCVRRGCYGMVLYSSFGSHRCSLMLKGRETDEEEEVDGDWRPSDGRARPMERNRQPFLVRPHFSQCSAIPSSIYLP